MPIFEALIVETAKRRDVAKEYHEYLEYYDDCFKNAKRLLVEGRGSRKAVMTADKLEELKNEWLAWLTPRLLPVLNDHAAQHTPAWDLFPFYLNHRHDPAKIYTNIVKMTEPEEELDEATRREISVVTPCPCNDKQPNSEFGSRRMAPISGCSKHAAEDHLLGWLEQIALDLRFSKGDYEEDDQGPIVDIQGYFLPKYRTVIGDPTNLARHARHILRMKG